MTPEERPLCPLRDFKPCVGDSCAWSVGYKWMPPDGGRGKACVCAIADANTELRERSAKLIDMVVLE